jgi:hypothetical protein
MTTKTKINWAQFTVSYSKIQFCFFFVYFVLFITYFIHVCYLFVVYLIHFVFCFDFLARYSDFFDPVAQNDEEKSDIQQYSHLFGKEEGKISKLENKINSIIKQI